MGTTHQRTNLIISSSSSSSVCFTALLMQSHSVLLERDKVIRTIDFRHKDLTMRLNVVPQFSCNKILSPDRNNWKNVTVYFVNLSVISTWGWRLYQLTGQPDHFPFSSEPRTINNTWHTAFSVHNTVTSVVQPSTISATLILYKKHYPLPILVVQWLMHFICAVNWDSNWEIIPGGRQLYITLCDQYLLHNDKVKKKNILFPF